MNNEDHKSRHAYWRQLVEEQTKSNMTQKEFCEKNGVNLGKFVYYRSLLNSKNNISKDKATSFSPVKVVGKDNINPSSEIKLLLPNGFQCSFPSHLDMIQVKRLVEVLLAC